MNTQGEQKQEEPIKEQLEDSLVGQKNNSSKQDEVVEQSQEDQDVQNNEESEHFSEQDQMSEENEEEARNEEEDMEEEDFSQYSKQALLSRLKELVKDENPLRVNRKIQDIKKYFEIYLENEHRVALNKFLEAGNDEMDFQPKPDPMKDEFFQIFNDFKKKRNAHIEKINEEKEENLKAKRRILDEMKQITENIEEVRNGYQEFKRLQSEWRNIGHVPKNELENLRKSYRFYVNKFYDNQSIYAEFKELDRKKNLESKKELCHRLEENSTNQDIREINKEVRRIEDEWHHIGPVPREETEYILNRFNSAMAEVDKQRQALEDALKEERERNLEKKREIVDKIKEMQSFESEKPKEWVRKNDELSELIQKWKSIGFVPYNKKDEIAREFREAVRAFNHRKNEFFKRKKKERAENLKRKKDIIQRAKELLEPEDFKAAKNEILNLQTEWKTIGGIPAKESEKLWKEFRKVCDEFFDKLGEHYKEREKEEEKNLEAKRELCAKIEKAAEEGVEDPESAFKEYQEEWDQIGFVPFKQKDKIRERYNKALQKILDESKDQLGENPELLNFKIKVDGMKEQNKTNQIKNEERKLSRKLKSNEEEINLLENNIQLFGRSENAQKLVEDYQKKIDELKNETELIREKLDMLKED